jgi:hypothetical protein
VKFEAEPIFFVERVLFDEAEFLHGGEETIDSGLAEVDVERYLRDGHFGAVLSEVQGNAHGLAQRFAGTGFAVIGRELSTMLRSGGQRGASERAQGRKKNSLLMRKRGERK